MIEVQFVESQTLKIIMRDENLLLVGDPFRRSNGDDYWFIMASHDIIINAHRQATVYAIGQKGASMMVDDQKKAANISM